MPHRRSKSKTNAAFRRFRELHMPSPYQVRMHLNCAIRWALWTWPSTVRPTMSAGYTIGATHITQLNGFRLKIPYLWAQDRASTLFSADSSPIFHAHGVALGNTDGWPETKNSGSSKSAFPGCAVPPDVAYPS